MVLSIDDKVPAVPEQHADEKDIFAVSGVCLSEINEHLLTGRCIEYMIIDPCAPGRSLDDGVLPEIADIVPERLFISRQGFEIAVFNELLFQDVIHRTYAEIFTAGVVPEHFNDRGTERLHIKGLVLLELFSRIVRQYVHVEILSYGWQ